MGKRRKYTEEFKREAVRLMETRGERTIADIADSLGIAENLLHSWRRTHSDVTEEIREARGETPEEELKRLRRENAQLKRDKEILKKSRSLLRQGELTVFEFIHAEKANCPVRDLCRNLEVSASGYYAWARRPRSRRSREDERLCAEIRAIHAQSRSRYGSPRVHRQLKAEGRRVAKKRVARLMLENGLRSVARRRFRRTTDSQHKHPVAPNLLGQNFASDAPNQVWVGDITYVWTLEGWAYLAVLLDVYSRRVVGWALRDTLNRELALTALRRALMTRRPPQGLLHHTDRGCQYASREYRAELASHGLLCSMSGPGNCYDNAVAESFFATLKKELVHSTSFATRTEAYDAISDYIENFYNAERLHSALGYRSPNAHELARHAAIAA